MLAFSSQEEMLAGLPAFFFFLAQGKQLHELQARQEPNHFSLLAECSLIPVKNSTAAAYTTETLTSKHVRETFIFIKSCKL